MRSSSFVARAQLALALGDGGVGAADGALALGDGCRGPVDVALALGDRGIRASEIALALPAQERVHTARRNHDIAGQNRTTLDPEILSLGRAAKEFRVSDTTIKRLVHAGLLKVEQVAPWAPWEIRRADLEAAPIRTIVEHLHHTGELVLPGVTSTPQPSLFQ